MQLYFELLKLYNIIPFSEWKKKQPKTNKQKKKTARALLCSILIPFVQDFIANCLALNFN